MPAGDVFGLDGIFLNKSNPITVSVVDINPASSSAGIAITDGSFSSGTITLNLSNAAGLTTTPFYVGAVVGVSSISQAGIAHTGYNGTFVVTGFAGTTTVSYATTGYVGSVAASIGATTIGYVQLLTDGNVTNTTWSSAQTHGWFGGGASPAVTKISTVDRIDFSNDTGTANVRGSLSLSKNGSAATGNSNYGWFGGGNGPIVPGSSSVSTVERVDFSNDSATASVRGSLSLVKDKLAATGNSNYGWFVVGVGVGVLSTVDRIDFSNDSATASVRGPLFQAKNDLAATGNSNYGWFGGGYTATSTNSSTVDRIDFSNDSSTASLRGSLSLSRQRFAATGNSNYGWFGGGVNFSLSAHYSTVDRIDFSNDSVTALVRGPLSLARRNLGATGNSNYGWFGGGYNPPFSGAIKSTIDRIDFSNDSVTASVRGPLSSTRYGVGATSGQARSSSTRLQKAGNYGWFGAGRTGPSISDGSSIDRIDFFNDSVTASPRGPLNRARYSTVATGNSNYGWFGGGSDLLSTVDRIDFSNDSATASIRGPLDRGRYNLTATGNSNYGWFGGGYTFTPAPETLSRVDRIDFSNDFSTASVRGPLSLVKYNRAATGNSNYGWFGGGTTPAPVVSTVDRVDFSNDSATASPRGSLSSARGISAATGNSNYGWFGGGPFGTPSGTVDRIDFSNDYAIALLRGPLSSARYNTSAAGNSNYGWFGGGAAVGANLSIVDRINFSNDFVTASIRGSLSVQRYGLAATSNTSFS
jgi:hypothetical protein